MWLGRFGIAHGSPARSTETKIPALSAHVSYIIVVITAGVLVYAALIDLRDFRIRNELIVVLVVLYGLHSFASGRWAHDQWNLLFTLLMLAFLIVFYARRWIGGGDVKILTVGFLWVGLSCAFPFSLLLTAFAFVHVTFAKLGWAPTKGHGREMKIPFAPSVAAALISIFMSGCLQPL